MKESHAVAIVLALGFITLPARADHGPGGSGGGVTVASAETLKKGTLSLTLGVDYTSFENVDDPEGLERSAASGDHVDAIDHGFIETVGLAYGLTDSLEIGLATGYYSATGARIYDAGTEDPEEEPHVLQFDPKGMTDLWLNAKYRLQKTGMHSSALFGGIKAPTGRDDAVDSEGEEVEPPSQAGTGAWDASLGFAHTAKPTARVRVDASLRYTLHQRHDGFRIGDRLDAGVSACYRISLKHYPRWYAVGELNARLRQRNEEGPETITNSGGKSYLATAGFVTQLSDRIAVVLVGVTPILEDLNGSQVETRFKVQAQLSFEF